MSPPRILLWGLVLIVPLALGVTADADLWWHIAAGRMIVEQGALPAVDTWSYTQAGTPWVNHEWLPGSVMAVTFDALGSPGLLALRAVVLAVLMLAWLRVVGRRLPHPALAVLLVGLPWPLLANLCNLRPQTLTWALVPVVIGLVDQAARRRWWAAPLLVLTVWFWANAHGGFLFGWGLAGLGLLLCALNLEGTERPSRRQRLGFLVAAALVAVCPALTPNGVHLLTYIATELTTPHPDLPEWNPPNTALMTLILIAAVLPFLAWSRTRVRIRPTAWIGLLVATAQSMQHAKFVVLVLLLLPICLADALGPSITAALDARPDLRRFLRHPVTFAGAVLTALLAGVPSWPTAPGEIVINPRIYPEPAIAWLAQARAPTHGRLLLPLGWGGMAIYWLHPEWTVAIDGRNTTIYPIDDLIEHRRAWAAADLPSLLDPLPDVVLARTPDPVTAALRPHPDWTEVYSDDTSSLFIRADLEIDGPEALRVDGVFP